MHGASTEDVQVQVVDGLTAVGAGVGDDAEAAGEAFLLGDLCGNEHEMAEECLVRFDRVRGGGDVFLRDDEHVRRGDGMQVAEGEGPVVLKDFGGGDGARDDAAEDAVSHG